MGRFHRTNEKLEQLGFVRGPARLLAAPITQSVPSDINGIVKLGIDDVNAEQSIQITGDPTGGTFTLTFEDVTSAAIAHDASAADVKSALEQMSSIGEGNVDTTGGPLPDLVTVEFVNELGGMSVSTLIADGTELTGGTDPEVVVAVVTEGEGEFDPQGSWFDLGGTKNGVQVIYNTAEEEFTIDQEISAIGSQPTSHELAMQTNLVEVTPETIEFAWEAGEVTLNTDPDVNEKKVGVGTPTSYTTRRLAILHRRPSGLIRAHFMRRVQRSPIESTFTYAPTGEQQSVPVRLKALGDTAVSDERERFGFILDQQAA